MTTQPPTTEKASETPRTDREFKRQTALCESWPRRLEGAEKLARLLERELTAVQRQNEELQKRLEAAWERGDEKMSHIHTMVEQAAEIERLRKILGDIQIWATQALTCSAVTLDIAPGFEQIADAAKEALTSAPAGERVGSDSVQYRAVREGEVIEANDEVLTDDFGAWEPVKGKGTLWPIGCAYAGSFFKPMRRPVESTAPRSES